MTLPNPAHTLTRTPWASSLTTLPICPLQGQGTSDMQPSPQTNPTSLTEWADS